MQDSARFGDAIITQRDTAITQQSTLITKRSPSAITKRDDSERIRDDLESCRVASGEAEGRHCRATMGDNEPKSSEKAPGFFANTFWVVHKNEFLKIFKAT